MNDLPFDFIDKYEDSDESEVILESGFLVPLSSKAQFINRAKVYSSLSVTLALFTGLTLKLRDVTPVALTVISPTSKYSSLVAYSKMYKSSPIKSRIRM